MTFNGLWGHTLFDGKICSFHDICPHIKFEKTIIYTKSITKNKRHKLLYVLFNIVLAFNVMVIFLTNNIIDVHCTYHIITKSMLNKLLLVKRCPSDVFCIFRLFYRNFEYLLICNNYNIFCKSVQDFIKLCITVKRMSKQGQIVVHKNVS